MLEQKPFGNFILFTKRSSEKNTQHYMPVLQRNYVL